MDEYKLDPILPEVPSEETPASDPYGQRIYDHDGATWKVVPADEAVTLIGTGKYTYASGIEIPVISPEGERYSIPSEKAYDAFKEGFRPVTAASSAAMDQAEKFKSDQRIYDNQPIEAAVGGFLRAATLGGSDVALDAMGLSEGASKVRDFNPGASMAGEVGGIAASALYGGGAFSGAKAATRAGESIAAKVGAGQIASKAAGAAVEGAYFGLGSGISEVALGHPDSVVDTLAAHMGVGALIGGVAGGVFGLGSELKPGFDKLVSRAADGVAGVVSNTARKAFAKGAVPVLERAGVENAAARIPGFTDDIEMMRWVSDKGGMAAVEAEVARAAPFVKAAQKEAKALSSDITAAAGRLSTESSQVFHEVIEKSGKNIYEAARLAEAELERNAQNLQQIFASQSSRPITSNTAALQKMVLDTVAELRSFKSAPAQKVANNLETLGGTVSGIVNEAQEANILYSIAQYLKPHLTKSSETPGREVIGKLWQRMDDSLLNHQNQFISTTYGSHKIFNTALAELRDVADSVVSRSIKGSDLAPDSAKAFKALINPESRSSINAVLDNFEAFGPELKQFQSFTKLKGGIEDVAAKADLQQQIENKIKAMVPGANVNIAEVESLFTLMGKKADVEKSLGRLQELRTALDPAASSFDKALAVKKAMGQDTKDLEKLVKYQDQLRLYDELVKGAVPKVSAVKTAIGGTVGGIAGMLYGLEKSNLQNYAKAVVSLHSASEAGAKLLSKGVVAATEALTSKGLGRTVGSVSGNVVNERRSIKDQRKAYKEARTAIDKALLQSPIQKEQAPNISKAMQQKQVQALKFIQSKMPEDPFQASAINMLDSGYLPSDYEVAKFNRYVAAVDNPVTVLNSIAKGNVTPEEIETLKELYPRIYVDLQKSVLDAIIAKRGDIAYKQKVELATLFDIPTDYTLQSDFIGRMQENVNKDQGGRPEGGGQSKTVRGQLDLKPNETLATSAQRTTYKGQI